MFNDLLKIKFVILLYITLIFMEVNDIDRDVFIISILLYIFFSLMISLIENSKLKVVFFIASIIVIIVPYNFLFEGFMLLLPINIYEVLRFFKVKIYWGVILNTIVLFYINTIYYKEYLIFILIIYAYTNISIELTNKETAYEEEVYCLKKKLTRLNDKLNKSYDYQENLKYLTKIEERNIIAQEIHDNIGHILSGSLMQLEAVKMLISRDEKKAEKMIVEVINVMRDGMESVRSTLKNIKPSKEELGINRLKMMLSDFQNKSNINTFLNYNEYEISKISFLVWKLIFDNLKEIMTNTIKYSEARNLHIEIEKLNKFLRLSSKDDGVGCANIIKGLGLQGIEERIENIGGKVIIDGTIGFSIIILIPIKGE